MKLFDQVVVAVIAPEAVQVLKNLSPSTVTAHVVQVDSVSSIAEAARGCTVAYIVPPARDDKIDLASKMIAAVKEAGITKCAILSSIGADAENKPALAKFREIERIFKQAGFESSCILRGGFYSQNLLLYVDQINNQQLKLVGRGFRIFSGTLLI